MSLTSNMKDSIKNSFNKSSWLAPILQNEKYTQQLFCIPYAGGGASVFRNWKTFLAPGIELFGIQFPGRETRFSEPSTTDFSYAVNEIADSIESLKTNNFSIYGHSLGAAVAFELTYSLEQRGLHPRNLLISGKQSPDLKSLRKPIAHLSDQEFLRELMSYNSTPKEVLQNQELVDLLLPMLKADFFLAENYLDDPNKKVKANLTAIGSRQDAWLTPDSLEGWHTKTFGKFSTHWLDGGHLFLNDDPKSLIELFNKILIESST